ncbi:MAG: 50S ribosomal protein L10 [Proteobacteria bacterium]|nr:50S ribosomal protein L10 [Pseudomonadota bacterium]
MDRLQKTALVEELQNELKEASSVVISHYTGLTVGEMTQLRKQIREAGAGAKVLKNRLAKLAFKGTQFEGLSDIMKGQTIITFSEDAVAAAKITHGFAKSNEALNIVGGALNSEVLDIEGVKALAMMPSLDELRAKIIGTISAPAQRLAQYTQEPASKLARVCKARGEQAA